MGTIPGEALEVWRTKLAILTGLIEPEAAERGLTIDHPIQKYLAEVEATKSKNVFREYLRELEWFRKHCKKHYVRQLDGSDAMALFAQGRKEFFNEEPLNQKTINRRVIIMLHAMRSQGAVIVMKKGDWPRTVEKKIEIYQPEELNAFFNACTSEERLVFQISLQYGRVQTRGMPMLCQPSFWAASTT